MPAAGLSATAPEASQGRHGRPGSGWVMSILGSCRMMWHVAAPCGPGPRLCPGRPDSEARAAAARPATGQPARGQPEHGGAALPSDPTLGPQGSDAGLWVTAPAAGSA